MIEWNNLDINIKNSESYATFKKVILRFIETTTHYLHCFNYLNERMTLLTNLQNVEENILDRNYSWLSEILLLGDSSFNDVNYASNSTTQFIFDTNLWKLQKFEKSIYWAASSMNEAI